MTLKFSSTLSGGTFAVYSLLCRHAKITPFGNLHDSDKGLSQYSKKGPKGRRRLPKKLAAALEGSPLLQNVLLTFVLCGTCALAGDGVLTPPVSSKSSYLVLDLISCVKGMLWKAILVPPFDGLCHRCFISSKTS